MNFEKRTLLCEETLRMGKLDILSYVDSHFQSSSNCLCISL